jgi:hypothetical protein
MIIQSVKYTNLKFTQAGGFIKQTIEKQLAERTTPRGRFELSFLPFSASSLHETLGYKLVYLNIR